MIHFKVAFPPAKEDFDVPTEFKDHRNLLSGEIKAVCGNPIVNSINTVADKANWLFCLVNSWGAQQNDSIIKNEALRINCISFDHCLARTSFDAADKAWLSSAKLFSFCLPEIKVLMALVVAIHNTSLAR